MSFPERALRKGGLNAHVPDEGPIYLNLGCGHNGPESWVNIDRSPMMFLRRWPRIRNLLVRSGVLTEDHLPLWPANIQRRDLTRPLPFADCVANAVYSSHMLEHMFLDDARTFVRECHRVMAPGGILRLALPDGEQWARELIDSGNDAGGEAGLMYNVMLRAHPEAKPRGKSLVTFVGGSNWHRWQPTRGLVRMMLESSGFGLVQECQYRQGNLPELSKVEDREDSMFFEAIRA